MTLFKGWTLARYLGRQYALWLLVFLLGLSGIIYLIEIGELMKRVAGLSDTPLTAILRMGAYKLPDTVDKILPFIVLFAGMFTFWRLTRSQELIIARASGVSAWQFLAPALLVTLLFGAAHVTLINPVGASMSSRYYALENKYIKRGPSLELTGAGLWLRQEDGEKRYLLHADKVTMDPLTLTPLIVFIYDDQNKYLGRIDAKQAVLNDNAWDISSLWINNVGEMAQYQEKMSLATTLTLDKIEESMAQPNTISFWQLPSFIRALRSIGLPHVRHELQMQTLLAEPLLLCAMVFFAAAFSLRLNRRGGVLNAMMAGMMVGCLVYAMSGTVAALGANQTLPILIAAWATPLMALMGGQATLLYLEDG